MPEFLKNVKFLIGGGGQSHWHPYSSESQKARRTQKALLSRSAIFKASKYIIELTKIKVDVSVFSAHSTIVTRNIQFRII